MNSTIVFLFKRTQTPTPPLIPSGNLDYSFSSGFVSGVLNGWVQSLPVTGGAYRWITSAVVTGESDSTIIKISAWRAVAMLSEDGTARHTATIYKQSILDPGSPIASTSSYDFVLGVLVPPAGWSVTQPTTTTINTWAAEYTFVGLDNEIVVGTGYWGQTKVVAVAGIDGQNAHMVTIYKQTIEAMDYPVGGSYRFEGDILVVPAGWSRTMPTVSGVPTYMSTHRFSSNDPLEVILGSSWSYPVVIARMGYDYINRFNSVCFKYSLDQPATPVEGDYDNPVPTGWGDGIPALVEGQSLWSTSRMFYADNLLSTVWATPVKVSGNTSLSSKLQFSADNILWHDEPTTNDIYMRSGTNDGNGWVFSASVVIKGEGGDKGDTGNTGVQLYMWIAYAFDLGGVSGFTTGSPTSEHKCIGVAKNKTSAIESTDPADYIWTEWVGARGLAGANGVTTFTWYAYANSQDGVTDFTTGDWNNHSYIGMAFNKFTNVESLDATDYVWAKLNVTAQVTGICFLPALEQPSTPLGGTFIEPTGIGWFDGIPDLNNLPLWVSTRIFTSDGLAPQQASWTTPVKIGAPTNSVFLQFSIDNANWHDTPTSNDIYMRSGTSVNGGAVTWSAGVKIKGETGALGLTGATGSAGSDAVVVKTSGAYSSRGYPYKGNWYTITDNVYSTSGDTYVYGVDNNPIGTGISLIGKTLYGASSTKWILMTGDVYAENIVGATITGKTLQTSSSTTVARTAVYSSSHTDTTLAGEIHVWADLGAGLEEIVSIGKNPTGYGGDTVGKFGTTTYPNSNGGVFGASYSSTGVHGRSVNGIGVSGYSTNGRGMFCDSSTSWGLQASSYSGVAIAGASVHGNGIEGYASSSVKYDFKATGAGINGPFTGAHDGIVSKDFIAMSGDIIVDKEIFFRQSISNTVAINGLSTISKQKNVIGILVGISDADDMDDIVALRTWGDARELDNIYSRIVINSLGEGEMNVCKDGGNIEAGDYICSSNRAGKGMKQDDDLLHNYTVAKARETVVWLDEEDDIRMIACTYHCG